MTYSMTYSIGEIAEMFDVDPAGAWDLVLARGWKHVQPLPDTKWQITVPAEDVPK